MLANPSSLYKHERNEKGIRCLPAIDTPCDATL